MGEFYKVPFTAALDLVKSRQAILKQVLMNGTHNPHYQPNLSVLLHGVHVHGQVINKNQKSNVQDCHTSSVCVLM